MTSRIVALLASANWDPADFARAIVAEAENGTHSHAESEAILREARDSLPIRYRIPAVRMSAAQVDATAEDSKTWSAGSTHWRCNFACDGRRMSVAYHMGSAHKGAPGMWDVLRCLFSDAESAGESFESWAGDMGYDTDSRKAENTWKACRSIAKRLEVLFGVNLEAWRELSRDV